MDVYRIGMRIVTWPNRHCMVESIGCRAVVLVEIDFHMHSRIAPARTSFSPVQTI